MSDDDSGDGASGEREPDFTSMDRACPACGQQMRPADLGSGAVVLRCPRCGQTVI